MLFVHVRKRSRKTLRSSRLQMFFKIGVLKNFSIFARKLLCWRLFLINLLLKKRFQHRCFPVNIAKFLRIAVLWSTFYSLYFFEILCDDRILWTSLGTKLTFFIFLVLLHCFPNSSIKIRSPWLFRICFHTKIFNFRTHYNVGSSTILIESLKIRNNCRTLATSPSNLL